VRSAGTTSGLWRAARTLAVLAYLVGLPGCGGNGPRPQPPTPPSTPEPQPPPQSGAPRTIYVSPQGASSNDGSQGSPLDLATALSGQNVPPGSTIWLRGGTYRGAFSSRLIGRDDARIVVRGAPGERAVLDCTTRGPVLGVFGTYTTFQDFEIACSTPSRTDSGQANDPTGIAANESSHVAFINLIVHDLPGQGFGLWTESIEAEVYGTIVYYNGTNHFDHGIYTQNATGTKRIEDNIIFAQASHGIHAFGSEAAALDHFYIAGNVLFNNGLLAGEPERNILVGGLRVARDLTLVDNFTYYPPASSRGANNLGYSAGCADARVSGNYFVGPTALSLVNCLPAELMRNVLIGGLDPPDLLAGSPNNQHSASLPRGTRVTVRPNRYQPGRAHVIVYNWDLTPQVSVDLAPAGLASGQRFEIRDVQDLFGAPLVSATYTGSPVTLPMTGLRAAAPVWNQAVTPRHTAPEFAVFIVLPR
jgi:predicted small lipoprotein YifL